MRQFFQKWGMAAITLTICTIATAQPKTDSTKSPTSGPAIGRSTGPKPYREVITSKAISDGGLFTVHKIDDKYFFEVGDSLLRRDILVVNRISKASAGMRNGFFGYAGDQIGQNVIRFEKGPNNKIFLRTISFAEYAKDSTSAMFNVVNNSNVQPIVASFEIKAYSPDSTGTVIDVTDYINNDNDVLFFNSSLKSANRIGQQQSDKSYISAVRSYPTNVEINTVKTYSRSAAPTPGGGMSGGGVGNITLELNSSLVILPKTPMKPRYYDPRVGYFTIGYTDFDINPQGVESIRLVQRWRLEPKPEDVAKYNRGELVEPAKPIIFYIDPATPKKWIPYLIQGVNDWQQAFEQAGFKNAIVGKMAPTKEQDPDWSLEDARYSAIVYKPSPIANASGPRISDPRSGEIMESHINWYHNVMELIHHWYFVQCAPVDEGARKMVFDDDLMGQLIRFVSSHEVGHTLGLRHNYGSSSTVPVEKLRDKKWVEENGHTPSIMDYARFNYIAQPEDKISRAGLFARIGEYDRWAIEWGYKIFPDVKADTEKEHMNKWVIEKLKNKRLWFGTETNPDDPRSQREQIGDDAMKGSAYGIKNLQRIIPNLIQWTKEPNKDYTMLRTMYEEVTSQYSMYMGHVSKYIGGIMETPKMVEEDGPIYEIVAQEKQKEAVDFLNKQLFATPNWLIDIDIYSRAGLNGPVIIGNIQESMLNRILSTRNLGKIIDSEAKLGTKAYTIMELFTDLKKGIWSELASRKSIDLYRRNLQKAYIGTLSNLLNPPKNPGSQLSLLIQIGLSVPSSDNSDIRSVVRAHLTSLRNEIRSAVASVPGEMSRYHLQDVIVRIDNALNPKD
jgi:hypothetical protein